MEKKRVRYVDNLKWLLFFILIVYETVAIYNGCGAVGSISKNSIPIFDDIAAFIYPWLMPTVFLLSGICIRYSLQKRTTYEFIKERVKRVLIPAITFTIFLAPIVGWIASSHIDIFFDLRKEPNFFVKYLIYLFIGSDAVKILFTIFAGSLLIAVLKLIDKKDTVYNIFSKANIFIILLLVIPAFGASKIMNGNTVYPTRTGLYLFMMLIGYYLFSNQRLSEKFEKCSIFILPAIPLGIYLTWLNMRLDYTTYNYITNILVNIFMWLMVISLYGLASLVLDFRNKKTEYLVNNYYSFYMVHYVVMLVIAHIIITKFNLPIVLNYILLFILSMILIPVFSKILSIIPFTNLLLFGKKKRILEYYDYSSKSEENNSDEIIDDFVQAKKIRSTGKHNFNWDINKADSNNARTSRISNGKRSK